VFCPSCGTLSFPNHKGEIACTNHICGYKGPANIVIRGVDGREVDLSQVKTSVEAKARKFVVVKDSDNIYGVLTIGDYSCPKCNKMEVYSDIDISSEFSETATTMRTCKNCRYGWRVS
jgi:DNA-directed RNA polymerase subunit M/transcription elongation factor TFIIS|tara:strand:+ start:120 stop:473 length:354 start_codon:yes stop_codon:yes gene_type:complete